MTETVPPAERSRRGYRSLFWPVVLIGVGAIWLLVNLGVIPAVDVGFLLRLWPLLLILAGLDILIGRWSPALGGLFGLLLVGLVIALLIMAPAMGWSTQGDLRIFGIDVQPIQLAPAEVLTGTFSEPVGQATSARVLIGLNQFDAQIRGVRGTPDLIRADATYLGEMEFEVSGSTRKDVRLQQSPARYMTGRIRELPEHTWDVTLSGDVETDLTIDASSGRASVDLSALQLSALTLEASSGALDLILPPGRYPVSIDASSGSLTLAIPGGADIDLTLKASSGGITISAPEDADLEVQIDASSGGITFDLPRSAAVRVDVRDESSGNVRLHDGLVRVEGQSDARTGVWETANYGSAAHRITIIVENMSSGNINVR